ncbi:MAG: DUF885 domain-containing protein, partial [Kangiellaceae bacterium]|nr:DUF885 domain-containing protein [Kangiellaceae bacterium]
MIKKPWCKKNSQSALFLFVMFLSMIGFSSISLAYDNRELSELFDSEWQSRMERFPRFAESMGDKSNAARLTDVSEQAQQKWLVKSEGFLHQLNNIEQSALDSVEKINYQIFKQQLINRIAQLTYKDYQIPFLADSGFHTEIARLPVETEFRNVKDYQNYLARLTLVPQFFQQHIDNMNAGLRRGFSMPKVVMAGFTQVIHQQIKDDVSASPFYLPFKDMSKQATHQNSAQYLEKLKALAKSIIQEKVNPAYKNLAGYFEKIYIPASKQSLGAKNFPNGEAYYQHKIKQYTTVELTSKAIHEIGLREVERIRGEMDEVIHTLKFKGSFKEFLAFLRNSEQFYAR